MHLFIEQVCMDCVLWCARLPNLTQRKIVQAIRHYLGQVPNWLKILFLSISAFLLLNSVLPAYAQNYQNYPERPVRVLNPSSPGGGGDVIARIVMQELSKKMKKSEFVLFTDKGYAYANPLFGMLSTIETEIFKLLCQLGLTPVDRSKMGVAEVKARTKLEEIIQNKNESK